MIENVPTPPDKQPDALRRSLTKTGLLAPVVLATLASKPVLGAVPWKCTISGQLSGNVSGHEGETCTLVGKSLTDWQTSYPLAAASPTSLVSLFSGLTNYFWVAGSNLVLSASIPGPGYSPASVNQILNLTGGTTVVQYAQKAVVLLLNARGLTDTSNYPLTESQARLLYESAANPTQPNFVDTDPNVSWDYTQVKLYIDVLYH